MSEAGGLRFPLAVSIMEVVAALALAPRSCTGGLEIYFGIGGAALFACILFPWLRHPRVSPGRRAALGGLLSIGGWIGGLFLGNFQIFCRLF